MNPLRRLGRMLFSRNAGLFRLFRFGGTRIDYAKEVGDGLGSSVVSAVLGWIARNFPEAPPAVWPKDAASGQEKPVAGHPMVRLLERPNPFFTGPQLWMATVVDWHANGDAYWLKEYGRASRFPIRLWWVPSWMMEPGRDEGSQEFITHYVYTVDGEPLRVPVDRVVHFRYGTDPQNPMKGNSPLKAVVREVYTDDEAANYTATILRNMGVPGVIVSPDVDSDGAVMTTEEAEDVKATIRSSFTGDKRGDVAVLTGRTKVSTFGFSPEQLILRELRRIPEERVTAATGIPAIVVGFGAGLERSTFTNMGEAREAAYEAGLIPMQKIMAEDVRFQLLVDFETDPHEWLFGFDLSKVRVLQEDLYRQMQRYDVGIRGGWIQVAEGRRAAGLDVTDADEIYLRQTSYVEVPANGGSPRALASTNGNGALHVAHPGEVAREVIAAIESRERLQSPASSRRGGHR